MNLHSLEKRGRVLGIAGCNASPLLDVEERILDKVPGAAEAFIEGARRLAVLAGRNLGCMPWILA